MKPGTILGHEGVGVVEEVGEDVRNLDVGDRVVIGSTIGCGYVLLLPGRLLRAVRQRQPERPATRAPRSSAAPRRPGRSTVCRRRTRAIPYAHVTCVKLPDEVSDDQAILISDIFPTA